MEKLSLIERLDALGKTELRESKNRIQQTDARNWKAGFHDVAKELFESLDMDVYLSQNALLIEVPHEELGSIIVEAKFQLKPLDHDIAADVAQYEEKKAAADERKRKRERDKAIDQANRESK